MNILKSLFSRALLAVALATGAGAAAAGPTYHVDLDLSSFSGDGFLDMQFVRSGEFSPATATLTGFNKYFNEYGEATPTVSGSVSEGTVVFDNSDSWADLFQSVTLGKHLIFNLSFAGPDDGLTGTAFTVSLFDADQNTLVDPLLQFFVHPGDVEIVPGALATVTEAADVPEPSAAALFLLGLAMAGAVARRRA